MDAIENEIEPERGGHMSFLEHLDELRKRLVRSAVFLVVIFCVCFYFSEGIYNFLSVPIRQALNDASRRTVPVSGLHGDEGVIPIGNLKEGDSGRYVFDEAANLGPALISPGASVDAIVQRDDAG